jgi:hypothetical protein
MYSFIIVRQANHYGVQSQYHPGVTLKNLEEINWNKGAIMRDRINLAKNLLYYQRLFQS